MKASAAGLLAIVALILLIVSLMASVPLWVPLLFLVIAVLVLAVPYEFK